MNHEKYIKRCISIAQKAGKATRSNPMVGAVLVYNNMVIGEGFHEYYGGPHAEVNCINSVIHKSLIPKSTLYVSLEPCCISGKTPPCTNLIIKSGIKNVVISTLDINPDVHGKGVKMLRDHGIKVVTDILRSEGENLIRKFRINHMMKRPYILLKVVKSKDNYIGRYNEKIWLTNGYSDIYTHKLRGENDGIMAGSKTILNDNPSLSTRHFPGENPVRVTIDRRGIIPQSFSFFTQKGKAIYFSLTLRELPGNIQQIISSEDDFSLNSVLTTLYNLEIYSLLVEGGTELIKNFISQGLWDEAIVISTKKILNNGISAPNIEGVLAKEFYLYQDKIQRIYPD